MNDQNSKYTEYSLFKSKLHFDFKNKTELSTGINNAGNTKYAASILPNAGWKHNRERITKSLGIIMEG
jgi:iron complex outermembrane receptor protein